MKTIKLIFTTAVFVAVSFCAQAQSGPGNTKFSIEADHTECEQVASDDMDSTAKQIRCEVAEYNELPFFSRFVTVFYRLRLF